MSWNNIYEYVQKCIENNKESSYPKQSAELAMQSLLRAPNTGLLEISKEEDLFAELTFSSNLMKQLGKERMQSASKMLFIALTELLEDAAVIKTPKPDEIVV